jgi:hypothetical protein
VRSIRFSSSTCSVFIALLLLTMTTDMCPPEQDTGFIRFTESFVQRMLALSPTGATATGYHCHIDPLGLGPIAMTALRRGMLPVSAAPAGDGGAGNAPPAAPR